MKKAIAVLLLTGMIAGSAFAGVDFSARAGVYSVPGGTTTSMMYGLAAYYPLTDSLTLRGAAETTTYSIGTVSTTYTPITVDLIYSKGIAPGLTAYAGGGASYNTISSAGVTTNTTGGQAEVGLSYSLAGMTAGAEYRYLIPDFNSTANASSSYAVYVTGGLNLPIL